MFIFLFFFSVSHFNLLFDRARGAQPLLFKYYLSIDLTCCFRVSRRNGRRRWEKVFTTKQGMEGSTYLFTYVGTRHLEKGVTGAIHFRSIRLFFTTSTAFLVYAVVVFLHTNL